MVWANSHKKRLRPAQECCSPSKVKAIHYYKSGSDVLGQKRILDPISVVDMFLVVVVAAMIGTGVKRSISLAIPCLDRAGSGLSCILTGPVARDLLSLFLFLVVYLSFKKVNLVGASLLPRCWRGGSKFPKARTDGRTDAQVYSRCLWIRVAPRKLAPAKQQKTHFMTPFMHSCGHSASAAGTKEKGILAPHPLRPSVRSLFSGGAGTYRHIGLDNNSFLET